MRTTTQANNETTALWHSQQISFVTLRSSVGKLDWNLKIKKVWVSNHPRFFFFNHPATLHLLLSAFNFSDHKMSFTRDKRNWQRFIWDLAGLLQVLLHLKCIWYLIDSFYSFNNTNLNFSVTVRSEFFTVSKLVSQIRVQNEVDPHISCYTRSIGGDIVCISPPIISSEEEEVHSANCCCTRETLVKSVST